MIKVDLFNELIEDKLISVSCERHELKSLLMHRLKENEMDVKNLIVLFNEKSCVLYMRCNTGIESIMVYPVARIRIETGFNELESDLLRIDGALAKQNIRDCRNKYCRIRKIDFRNNFIIADVYVAM